MFREDNKWLAAPQPPRPQMDPSDAEHSTHSGLAQAWWRLSCTSRPCCPSLLTFYKDSPTVPTSLQDLHWPMPRYGHGIQEKTTLGSKQGSKADFLFCSSSHAGGRGEGERCISLPPCSPPPPGPHQGDGPNTLIESRHIQKLMHSGRLFLCPARYCLSPSPTSFLFSLAISFPFLSSSLLFFLIAYLLDSFLYSILHKSDILYYKT